MRRNESLENNQKNTGRSFFFWGGAFLFWVKYHDFLLMSCFQRFCFWGQEIHIRFFFLKQIPQKEAISCQERIMIQVGCFFIGSLDSLRRYSTIRPFGEFRWPSLSAKKAADLSRTSGGFKFQHPENWGKIPLGRGAFQIRGEQTPRDLKNWISTSNCSNQPSACFKHAAFPLFV